jgi:hypothetical protein
MKHMNQMEKKHIMQDKKKDITPYNHKGRPHGHWEIYWSDKP